MNMATAAKVWVPVPIEQVYSGLFDGPHATPPPADEGPIFLGIKNITEDGRLDFAEVRHISEEDYSDWTRRVAPRPGDIVFTYEATLNRYAIIPQGFRGCLGRRLALIRPNPAKVDTHFLFYYFFSDAWRRIISKHTLVGATVDRIPLTTFPQFEIALPPLPAQHKIGAILSAYDDLIDNNTRRIVLLEEMAQALYHEWFIDLRFPGHEQHRMVESLLGPIPEGWEVKKLGDALELLYGKALTTSSRRDGMVPVYGSSGVVGYHNNCLVEGPGIIVGRKGNVGSVFWSDVGFLPIDTVFYVQSTICLYYLYFNLKGQRFLNSDAAVPGLNRGQAYSNLILVPMQDQLDAFKALIDPIFQHRRNLKLRNDNLNRSRGLLLPKLLSGEIDVEDLDIMERVA